MSAPEEVDQATLRACAPPRLAHDSDKEDRGRLLVLASGQEVAGAAILAATAGLRVGAGKLQVAAIPALAVPLALAMPEARVMSVAERGGEIAPEASGELAAHIARMDAVVAGPGMLDEAQAGDLARRLLASDTSAGFVLDAAALTGLAADPEAARTAAGRLVVTPHAGEMAAFTGRAKREIERDPLDAARTAARALKAVVVMKGAETFVVSPDGRAYAHRASLPGLGASGSGDVLAGAIGGLLARGCSPVGAAIWGVRLHARAGARLAERIGPLGFLARELLDELPRALAETEAALGRRAA